MADGVDIDMRGRIALVTGGGYGMGRASAIRFATAGAHVVVADIDADNGKKTVAVIAELGGEAQFVEADVAEPANVERLLGDIEKDHGRLDYAHNNAGVLGANLPIPDLPLDQWYWSLANNLTSVFLCMKYEIPLMKKSGGGAIVNVTSESLFKGNVADAAYTAGKHGVKGLTEVAGLAHIADGIRVNAVAPGNVETGITERGRLYDPARIQWAEQVQPIGRFGRSEEIAELVVWLCSDAASLINATVVAADSGWHVA